MSSYIVMRTDYMRIPQSSAHDQTQSIKPLRSESPHIDGESQRIFVTRESICRQIVGLPCIKP